MNQELNQTLEGLREEMCGTLKTLIAIPSKATAPEPGMPYGKGPAMCLEKALEIAGQMGFSVRNVDNQMGVADYIPEGADPRPALGILCHLDTVPEGSGWTKDPFGGVIEDGKLYGRGAIDDKGPAVSVLYAMKAIKDLNLPLTKTVRFLLGTNEECGSSDLVYYRAKEELPPLLFTPDGSFPVINIEKGHFNGQFSGQYAPSAALPKLVSLRGGMTLNAVPAQADAVLEGITLEQVKEAQKACGEKFYSAVSVEEREGRIYLHMEGKGAHASTPWEGENAVTGLISLVLALPLAECPGLAALRGVARVFPHGETDGKSAGVACSDGESGALTAAFSIFSYLEEGLEGKFDIRFPISAHKERLVSALRESLESAGLTLGEYHTGDPHHVSGDSDFVRTLLAVYEEHTGNKGECIAIGGGTYVHDTQTGVAFGAEFPGEENNMHGPDEFITVDRLVLTSQIYAHAIEKLCK